MSRSLLGAEAGVGAAAEAGVVGEAGAAVGAGAAQPAARPSCPHSSSAGCLLIFLSQ